VTGPLAGVRILEIASIGPGPFCAMVLSDLGAEVIRIERIALAVPDSDPPPDPLQRGRAGSIALDLKQPEGLDVLLGLVESADALNEGFRPGVMERLGAGPDECLRRNQLLVYGRMTGWGQDGERAATAGHDVDFLAIAGVLHLIGDPDRPPPVPLNLIADFGGGGMLLALGICAALVGRASGTPGQVIDAAMVDGSALLTAMFHGLRATGAWLDDRGANLLDGGAPFYRSYLTADDRYVAVGALEPPFFAALLAGLEIEAGDLPGQYDRTQWPQMRQRFSEVFRSRTRDEWSRVFAGTDACVVPVNDLGEAIVDAHMADRGSFIEIGGVNQPAPAPRFSVSAVPIPEPARPAGADADRILGDLGFASDRIAGLRRQGVIA
jgi:alpha-methylacyl-CoA racemase